MIRPFCTFLHKLAFNFSSAMRWLQQNTPVMSTKSCWFPSWRHFSWASVCCSYYSGSASMYEGTFNISPHESPIIIFHFQLLKQFVVNSFVSGDWSSNNMTHSSGPDDITHNRNWISDLIGLHWHYHGIIWTLGFFSQVKKNLYNFWCLSLFSLIPAFTINPKTSKWDFNSYIECWITILESRPEVQNTLTCSVLESRLFQTHRRLFMVCFTSGV